VIPKYSLSNNADSENLQVVALVDFEMSGFYPEYWEYCKAINVNPLDEFWKAEVGNFLEAYPRELEMEEIRKKHFSCHGFRRTHSWD